MKNLLVVGAEHDERISQASLLSMRFLCLNSNGIDGCFKCNNCVRIKERRHPNVTYIEPEKASENSSNSLGEIKISQVRYLVNECQKKNYEDGVAIFIITHAHQITKGAANSLLKVLEESGSDKVILALAPSRASVLPTIASRLVTKLVKPKRLSDMELQRNVLKKIKDITKTPPKERYYFYSRFSNTKQELFDELVELRDGCHVLLRIQNDTNSNEEYSLEGTAALRLGDGLDKAISNLLRNMNLKLVSENLLFRDWPYAL